MSEAQRDAFSSELLASMRKSDNVNGPASRVLVVTFRNALATECTSKSWQDIIKTGVSVYTTNRGLWWI